MVTKAQEAIQKQRKTLEDKLDVTLENLKVLEKEYGITEDLAVLTRDITKQTESQIKVTKNVIDNYKEVLDNSKKIAEETLTTVDLHKLEREAISEGLHDRVVIIQKMREMQLLQKQTNNIVNRQVGMFKSVGDSIENTIKSIPIIGGLLSDVLGVTGIGDELSEVFRTSFQSAFDKSSLMDNVIQGSVEGAVSGGVENVLSEGSITGGFLKNSLGKITGKGLVTGAALAGAVALFSFGIQKGLYSLSLDNAFKRFIASETFDGFTEAFGNLNRASSANLFNVRLNKLLYGASVEDGAKFLQQQTEISGLSDKQAIALQKQIMSAAILRGVLPEDIMKDMTANAELFATYSKDGGENLAKAGIRARELGLELSTIGKISDSILDFQTSIEAELQASLLIGRQLNLNKARELALMNDQEGMLQEIVKQVGSEAELNKLNSLQRKKLAQAIGIDVAELQKLAGGEVQFKSNDTQQNTQAIKTLTSVIAISAGTKAIQPISNVLGGTTTAALGMTAMSKTRAASIGRVVASGARGFGWVGIVVGISTLVYQLVQNTNGMKTSSEFLANQARFNNNNFRQNKFNTTEALG